MRRVVITGYGVISALGEGKTALNKAMAQGRSGVAPVTQFDTHGLRCHTAAEIRHLPNPIDRTSQLLESAVREAMADATLAHGLPQLAVFQGTAHGPQDRWLNGGDALPASVGASLWREIAQNVSVTTITSACVASTWGAGLAMNAIRRGEIDLAMVAGVEVLTDFLFRGFDSLRSLTTTSCRPFDRRRDGLILGEGAAVLVLEAEEAARRRGAPIRAELAGFGIASDARHLTAPDINGKGAASALSNALDDAGIGLVDYINVHGTGTVHNDLMEVNALKRLFGEQVGSIAISSTKAMTGHTSGAAGALELGICLSALEQGLIPPTAGLEEIDPLCCGLDIVGGQAREFRCNTIASMNSAFGGNNAAIVLRRYQ